MGAPVSWEGNIPWIPPAYLQNGMYLLGREGVGAQYDDRPLLLFLFARRHVGCPLAISIPVDVASNLAQLRVVVFADSDRTWTIPWGSDSSGPRVVLSFNSPNASGTSPLLLPGSQKESQTAMMKELASEQLVQSQKRAHQVVKRRLGYTNQDLSRRAASPLWSFPSSGFRICQPCASCMKHHRHAAETVLSLSVPVMFSAPCFMSTMFLRA